MRVTNYRLALIRKTSKLLGMRHVIRIGLAVRTETNDPEELRSGVLCKRHIVNMFAAMNRAADKLERKKIRRPAVRRNGLD